MKLTTEPRTLEKIGVMEELEYSIEVTPQAMEVLSGLYSDIPWAIVREYGTNMLDAYVKLPATAKRIAPQLHVPNTMEPWIEFKDFGTGMDEKSLRTIFTRYFASTKRDNNEEVGGLGLGAKTAYCYDPAESWVVESRFGGTKYVFHASKNERHIPALNLIGAYPTDESNGVTVKIPVANTDIPRFRTACERLLRFYPIPVEVVGAGPNFDPKALEYKLRGKTWGLRYIKGTNATGSTAIMGNVPYPIDHAELEKNTKFNSRYSTSYNRNWAIDLWFPVGALRVVPSREGLMYTPQTRKALAAAVEGFEQELPAFATSMIQDAPTKWEALKQLHALFIEPLSSLISGAKWKGQELNLTDGIEVKCAELPAGVVIQKIQNERQKSSFSEQKVIDAVLRMKIKQKHYLFVDDLPKLGWSLVRQYMLNECTSVAYNGRRQWKDNGVGYIFTGVTKHRLQQIFGGAPVQTTSELQVWRDSLIVKDPITLQPRKPTKVRKYDTEATNTHAPWVETEVDANAGGYFIALNKDDPTHEKINRNETIKKVRKHAVALGYMLTTDQLIGIPRTLESLERKPGWIDVLTYIEEKLKADLAKNWVAVATWRTWEKLLEGGLGEILSELLTSPPTRGRSKALWRRMNKVMPDLVKVRALSNLALAYSIPVPEHIKPEHDGAEEFQKLIDSYPLLKVIKALDDKGRKKPYDPAVPLKQFTSEITEYLNT